jgi:hypothetical protein
VPRLADQHTITGVLAHDRPGRCLAQVLGEDQPSAELPTRGGLPWESTSVAMSCKTGKGPTPNPRRRQTVQRRRQGLAVGLGGTEWFVGVMFGVMEHRSARFVGRGSPSAPLLPDLDRADGLRPPTTGGARICLKATVTGG